MSTARAAKGETVPNQAMPPSRKIAPKVAGGKRGRVVTHGAVGLGGHAFLAMVALNREDEGTAGGGAESLTKA
jgi:hypothetical protein